MLAAIVDIMQRENNGIWYGSVIIKRLIIRIDAEDFANTNNRQTIIFEKQMHYVKYLFIVLL